MRDPVSVCMASYNGFSYIKIQIESILKELSVDGDELIIVDDCSTDDTVKVIKAFTSNVIKLYCNEINFGYVKTFERAIYKAQNRYICLSDQDDIWISGRLNKMFEAAKKNNVSLIASNFEINNQSKKNVSFYNLKNENSSKYLGNIRRIFLGKSAYYGCTMMIDRNLLKFILPFPGYIEAHDLYIAMTANLLKSVYHISDNTLIYNIHQNNSSLRKRSLQKKIKARYYFFKTILHFLKKRKNNNF
ncbi:glycosyltransferase [Chryseobacterium echinoideorum]|uniref:glycosyltransferase n=1 Tax=Chryseobacterium echinoideorum TaxID=1549648 RepID=UPI001186F767|nr:glycosyltransferase [Chryseobacterium echinoideorum]